MKNHEAEELHDELISETKDHANTLHEWRKDIDRCNALQAELTQLKEANAALVKASSGMLENYIELKRISLAMARSDSPNWIGARMTPEDDIHVQAVRQAIDTAAAKGTQ